MPPSATDGRRLRELGPRGLLHLLAAASTLPLLRASIAVLGLRRTATVVRRGAEVVAAVNPRPGTTPATVLYERIEIAGRRGPIPATCLPQSLLLWAWLRSRGTIPSLRIGVGEAGTLMRAHAWVEVGPDRYGYNDEDEFDGFDVMRWSA